MSIVQTIAGKAAGAVLTRMSRKRLPQTAGTVALNGLTETVEVRRDTWGVPHIYARTPTDLFFAQGYCHAQDRLWQMELNRRVALGQLSDLFGEEALETDIAVRTFGFQHLGVDDWRIASQELKEIIRAYTAGINAVIERQPQRLPVEFSLIRHRPTPWRPEDCTAFARLMMWKLSHAWYSEVIRSQIIAKVGERHAAELEINYPSDNPVTLPGGIEFNCLDSTGLLKPAVGPYLKRGLGSNAWALAGSRSTTGNPLLCNDIHLPLSQPGLWYVNHLVSAPFEVTGVSLPGLPLVLVGHNRRIAWGITLAFTDAEDLFIEEVDPNHPHRYRFEDRWHDAEIAVEKIDVKGRARPHELRVLKTRHGPIISDVVGIPHQQVALCSMALKPGCAFDGYRLLNLAQEWDAFVAALKYVDNTQLNITYADVEGNIGHWVTGKVPLRAKGDGTVPSPGWSGEYEWHGEVPFEAMPHTFNPLAGYVLSCNHQLISDDYPYYLGNAWMNGYRARRLESLLNVDKPLSPQKCMAMQMDMFCLPGVALVSHLNELIPDSEASRLAINRLAQWDGQLTPESVGGAIYEVTRFYLVRNLLEPGLGEALTEILMGRGFHPLLLASHEFYGYDTVTMLRLLKTPGSWWVRQAGGKEAMLNRSLAQAVDWLRETIGPNPDSWQWGRIHRLVLAHPMGQKKPLDRVFNRGPYPIGGDTDTLFQTACAPEEGYDTILWAPSYRQLVDLGDLSQSLFVIPGGQSGQLASPHYDDLSKSWLAGEYLPMLWTREQVKDHTAARLKLTPVSSNGKDNNMNMP